MKNIVLDKINMVRANYLQKQGVFAKLGITNPSTADKLAVVNGYFTTKTLPLGLPVVQQGGR